jgi:glycosyltransferase involved in cell wall biosynthesis
LRKDTPLYFVLPEEKDKISGGNIYNRYFIQAVQRQYQPVYSIHFDEYQVAIEENREGMYWVDSLLLDRMQPILKMQAPNTQSGFILHLLHSLFPPANHTSDEIFEIHEKEILQYFKAFLVTSKFSKDYLLKRGFTDDPIMVVPPALCLKSLQKRQEIQGIQALIVSNIIPMKGILEFLKSLKKRAGKMVNHPFRLQIVGRTDMNEEYARHCMDMVSQSPLLQKIVNFTGPVPHQKMHTYYYSSNLFISPSAMETYGMALQEAKAFQLPILARKGGFIPYHIEQGKNGYMFSSVDALAEYILYLLDEPEAFTRLQTSARQYGETLEDYTWDDAASIFLTGIKSL